MGCVSGSTGTVRLSGAGERTHPETHNTKTVWFWFTRCQEVYVATHCVNWRGWCRYMDRIGSGRCCCHPPTPTHPFTHPPSLTSFPPTHPPTSTPLQHPAAAADAPPPATPGRCVSPSETPTSLETCAQMSQPRTPTSSPPLSMHNATHTQGHIMCPHAHTRTSSLPPCLCVAHPPPTPTPIAPRPPRTHEQ